MGVRTSLQAVRQDAFFKDNASNLIVVNDLPLDTLRDKDRLRSLLVTEYGKEADSLDTAASCACGMTKGNNELGNIAPCCRTVVEDNLMLSSKPFAWVRAPKEARYFFTPIAWMMLSRAFSNTRNDWNGMAYLCKHNYPSAPEKVMGLVAYQKRLDSLGYRGIDKVMDNLDDFLEFVKAEKRDPELSAFLDQYRDELVTEYLPIPSKVAFVINKTHLGDFTDQSLKRAMEAIQQIIALSNATKPTAIVNRTVSIMEDFRKYYDSIFSVIGKKKHWFRKAVFGSRMGWSFRTVISSRYGTHHYEELEIPYAQACVTLRVHLLNRLMRKHGFSVKEANVYIDAHSTRTDPFLLGELNALVRETHGGLGFWCTLTRYPSLSRGSTQLFRITGFKESSTTISPLMLVAPNADFDGDNMTGCVLLSHEQRLKFEYLRAHYGIFNNSVPGTLNSNTKLPDATISTYHAWVEDEYLKYRGMLDG